MKDRFFKKILAVSSSVVMLLGLGVRKFKMNRGKLSYVLVMSLLMNFVLIINAPVTFAAEPEILINYNFDDENALDSSGHGNDGTIHGPVSFVEGYHGKAIDLTGGNGYVSLPANMILNNTSFTVSMRFKTTDKGGLFGYQNDQVEGVSTTEFVPILCVRSDGKLYAEMWTGDSMTVLSDNVVNDGQWHRVVMTSGANSLRVYLDGNDIGGNTGTPNHLHMSISQIGTNAAWGRALESTTDWNYFNGYIDEFLFYPVAQTSDEVSKTDQAISFDEIPTKKTNDSSFDLTATASSGLDVTYSSSNTDVATISGNTVTIQGAGTTNITASQAGDDTYSAAPPVTRTLTVEEAEPTAAELANASIATAKGLIPTSFTATEGTDTNLLTYLNGITGMSDTGVTLSLDSSNENVADNGTITYGSSSVTDDVVVHINKADGTEDTKTMSVTVPAYTLTDADAVAGAKTDLDSSDLTFGGSDTATTVTQNFTLPLTGSNGTTISWAEKTDTGNNISLSGDSAVVTRPAHGAGDKTVTLTATITKNGVTETKDIEVTVKEADPTAAELANASIATAKGLIPTSFTATEGTDTNLLTYLNGITGMSDTGVTLTLDSSNGNVADDGTITYGSSSVTDDVVVHINKADGTEDTKAMSVTVPVHALTDAEAVAGAKTDLDSSDLTFGGSDTATEVTQNFTLPLTGSNGTTIIWAEKTDTGNNISLSGDSAVVTRPAHGAGDKTVTLTATITKNGVTETKDIEVTVKQAARKKSSSSSSSSTVQETLKKVVEVNGEQCDAGTATTKAVENKSVTTITIDDSKLDKILADSGDKPTVSLPAEENADEVVGELNGQTVKNMESNNAVLEIRTGTSSYSLPAAQINIDAVASSIGKQVELKDIEVSVSISESSADMVKIAENRAEKNSYQIVVEPVEFAITCNSGDKTVEVSKFNGYVERMVAIPDGINPSKITTGVVLNSDGTVRHVPTHIEVIDGKYFAKINSLTNSTYSVIYNPVEMADVANHWAKDSVNDMASRLVVSGDETGCYYPDKTITRAEFAAIIVRALGLAQGTTESSFLDVSHNDWFNGYVMTATEYGLIQGYDQNSFGPNDLITREQAMVILNHAMTLTGLKETLSDVETESILFKYNDAGDVSDYAADSVAAAIESGIVTGRDGNLIAPKENITRAEVAVIAQKLLEKSDLI